MPKINYKSIFFYIFLIVLTLIESRGGGDFKIFLDASQDFFKGKNIYIETYNEFFHYYYDLFFAIIIYPLSFLPLFFAKFIWISFNIFLISKTWDLLFSWLPKDLLTDKSSKIFKIIIWIFMLRFFRDNLHLCQMTISILFLCLKGLDLIRSKKIYLGALFISIGISIKILPIVLLPYLLFRSYFKESILIVLFFIILQILPVIFIDFQQVMFLLNQRWYSLNPSNANHILDTAERSFHSLTTLLSTLLVEKCGDTYALPIKRNIANISLQNLKWSILILRLILISFTLFFLKNSFFKKQENSYFSLYELSYIFLLVPLIFPHQQHYAFYFLFPSIVYLTFYWLYQIENDFFAKNKLKFYFSIIYVVILYFSTNCHLILGTFNEYYDHFKVLTYGTLLFIPILAISSPKKLNLQTHS
jgi:hypothetical protein